MQVSPEGGSDDMNEKEGKETVGKGSNWKRNGSRKRTREGSGGSGGRTEDADEGPDVQWPVGAFGEAAPKAKKKRKMGGGARVGWRAAFKRLDITVPAGRMLTELANGCRDGWEHVHGLIARMRVGAGERGEWTRQW